MLQNWLGGRDSWRRIVAAGVAGGLALAILAALVSSVCTGGSGSLDVQEPTVPSAGPAVVEPVATEPLPLDTAAPTATQAGLPESTATIIAEASATSMPTIETALPPTGEPTATAKQ